MYLDLTLNDQVEFTTDNVGTTILTRSSQATLHNHLECMLHWVPVEVDARTSSVETKLQESTGMINREAAQSFMERTMAVHTITTANETHLA